MYMNIIINAYPIVVYPLKWIQNTRCTLRHKKFHFYLAETSMPFKQRYKYKIPVETRIIHSM